jgi:hypothetical protein
MGFLVSESPILRYFECSHLPENLQGFALPFREMAIWIERTVPNGPEKSAGLRKLLEAKDCIVRAAI